MIRKIIKIDSEKCNGCGICVDACHEDAIAMIDGKAKLIRDDYCDGLGNCLPACPAGAISFEEREAAAFNEEAVKAVQKRQESATGSADLPCGCPGSNARELGRAAPGQDTVLCCAEESCASPEACCAAAPPVSELRQWPVQIKLVPVNAPYFKDARLLIAADCAAYAYGNFHSRYMKDRITLIGCPKLDSTDYSEKLAEIIAQNDIKSILVIRMEVPCCAGIEHAVVTAMQKAGKFLPWQVVTMGIDGKSFEA